MTENQLCAIPEAYRQMDEGLEEMKREHTQSKAASDDKHDEAHRQSSQQAFADAIFFRRLQMLFISTSGERSMMIGEEYLVLTAPSLVVDRCKRRRCEWS